MFFKKLFKVIPIIILLVISNQAINAQTLYELDLNEKQGVWEQINGTYLTMGDDNEAYLFFPFTFYWDNQAFTYCSVNTNGYLALGRMETYITVTPGRYYGGYNILAPFNRDLWTKGEISYTVTGSAGSQVITIQWRNVEFYYQQGQNFNFQVKLYEGSNRVEFIYGPGMSTENYGWYSSRGFASGHRVYYYGPYVNIRPDNPAIWYKGNSTGYWFNDGRKVNLPPGKTYIFGKADPELAGVYPSSGEETRILLKGYQYTTLDETHPSVDIKRESTQQDVSFKYKISGPMPTSNPDYRTIYTAIKEGSTGYNPDDDIVVPNPQPVGDPVTYFFTEGFGIAANQSPNDGGLDLRDQSIAGGKYVVETSLIFDDTEFPYEKQFFQIALENDIAIHSVQSPKPKTQKKYPLSASRVSVEATVSNLGVNRIDEFEIFCEITDENGAPVYEDSYLWVADTDPFEIGETIKIDKFERYRPNAIGEFNVKFWVDLIKAVDANGTVYAIDQELVNNEYPRSGETYQMLIAHNIEASADTVLQPQGQIFVNRPIRPVAVYANNGVSDISNADVKMTISKNGVKVYESNGILKNIPQGRVNKSSFSFTDYFEAEEAGIYDVCIEIDAYSDGIATNNSYCTTFEVKDAISGEYTIGMLNSGQERNYDKIADAVADLYLMGVSDNVTYILTDALYEEGDEMAPEAAIDISSQIRGVSEDATITFKPSVAMKNTKGSIEIRLHTGSGIGLLFGQNDYPSHANAVVHSMPKSQKAKYSNSAGYINFDGGSQKSIKFTMKSNSDLRIPIYLSQGASNIAIKNCIIDGEANQAASMANDLPGYVFNASQNLFYFEKDMRDDGGAYSAAVVLRSTVPGAFRLTGNENDIDTLVNQNIKIENNEIKGFGYGIVDMGIGVIFKSGDSEFRRFYNKNNTYKNNMITNVARAGIFMANTENCLIESNRIWGIDGSHADDVAGILCGGESSRDFFGFNNIDLTINANEISDITGEDIIDGIRIEQFQARFSTQAGLIVFPEVAENTVITNNVIWGINTANVNASRTGIKVMTEREAGLDWWDDSQNTADQGDYFTRNDIIANNTIILGEDQIVNEVPNAAIAVLQSNNPMIFNNAINYEDNTTHMDVDYSAFIYMVGKGLDKNNPSINYNAYWTENPEVSIARLINTNDNSFIIEAGFKEEFENLNQWRVWTGQDKMSTFADFSDELFYAGNSEPITLRPKPNQLLDRNSILNNRGTDTEILNKDFNMKLRGQAGQAYDIGAFEMEPPMYISDVETVDIPFPASYQSTVNEFSDAEYIMTQAPVDVQVHVRNNSTLLQNNIKVTTKIYIEDPDNADGFLDIPVKEAEARINDLESSDHSQLSFNLNDDVNGFYPVAYSDLVDYETPAKFRTMAANVTPKYKIEVIVDSDENNGNNTITKVVRFYIKRSPLNLILSAEHSHVFIRQTSDGLKSYDQFAGNLNFDALYGAFEKLGWVTEPINEKYDIDIFERSAWEERAVNYIEHAVLFWADAEDKALSRYQMMNLMDYFNEGTLDDKRNIIISSQDMLRENTNRIQDDELFEEFNNTVLRATDVSPSNPMGAGQSYAGNFVQGVTVGQNIQFLIRNTDFEIDFEGETYTDMPPYPGLMSLVQEGDGLAVPTHEYVNALPDLSSDLAGVATSSVYTNVLYFGVDWRHWDNSELLLRSILDYLATYGNFIVPIEIASFEANQVNKSVNLFWSTASERNASHILVEKANAADNNVIGEFAQIAKVKAQGSSASAHDYDPVIDRNVEYNNQYAYRLKLVDLDGKFTYSDVRYVEVLPTDGVVSIGSAYPNPAKDIVNVSLALEANTTADANLYDINGNVAMRFDDIKGDISFNTSKLASGQYTLAIYVNGQTITRVINVVK